MTPVSPHLKSPAGFTLIELVIVLVVIGIIGAVALRDMLRAIDDARLAQTRAELDQIAFAIAGNPALQADGARSDFGYVGDVGALPPDLAALVANPGLASWRGPYLDFGIAPSDRPSFGSPLSDAWDVPYAYTSPPDGPVAVQSSGSGAPLTRLVAPSAADLLNNTVRGFITDADRHSPGPVYRDSLALLLSYPDGAGGVAAVACVPAADGSFAFTGIPVGNHTLRVIFIPAADTLAVPLCVPPASELKLAVAYPADLW
ncbi:MAG TPA: prepilin-type N-terminal cleavage/methylation domain-containing protein [candidate division Zixibacteria bacterium]|nr:prepilin-type N-terminal cleavage/methylation domain-containing protein [candidate division Zixibacteria bacterium]MDD4916234.1 prepilin-type N-terminal cleavage/methylation domain-containing protein [candidate division Zixibacteria bacterium]MDM7972754.1 prepilin-type N-terminal cleavage/methylation domain-containing protein [candidate division Zixibacteria bacterium]HOD67028.1 prepilin-type N-terminal cleavage/methylation domain-containing protein [candidate division Zixibacteria bacterium]